MGVVSRRRVWLVGVGGIYGCGYWVWLLGVVVRIEVSSFYLSLLLLYLFFLQQHPYFLFIFKNVF